MVLSSIFLSLTIHVEIVVLLSQQRPDDHIEIEINLDEIDATSAETKATYKEIEEWVHKHYGFHIKKQQATGGCPEEKVKAIEEALKHFQMI